MYYFCYLKWVVISLFLVLFCALAVPFVAVFLAINETRTREYVRSCGEALRARCTIDLLLARGR